MADAPEVEDAKNTLREIKEHRAESMAKMQEAQTADFYFTVVCESDAQKSHSQSFGYPGMGEFCEWPCAGGETGRLGCLVFEPLGKTEILPMVYDVRRYFIKFNIDIEKVEFPFDWLRDDSI